MARIAPAQMSRAARENWTALMMAKYEECDWVEIPAFPGIPADWAFLLFCQVVAYCHVVGE
jgi:hypothetical protein